MNKMDLCDLLCGEIIDCNDCENINLTELKQRNNNNNGLIHYCYKYKKQLFHLGEDYHICPCEECIVNDYEEFEGRK